MTAENHWQVSKASIVRIYDASGAVVGAGFLVSNEYVLTCAHVITQALGIEQNTQEKPTESIHLDFPLIATGEKLTASVVFWQPVSLNESVEDIAGLKLNSKLPDAIQPIKLVTAENLWENSIRIFGFPKGHKNGVWASGVLRDKNAKGWLQMEDVKVTGYQVGPGFSGAPVWDEKSARVVGMAVAAEKRRENVKAAFIIPTQLLVKAWSILKTGTEKELPPWIVQRLQEKLTVLMSLKEDRQEYFKELAIFPEYVSIPISILQKFWNLGELDDVKDLCGTLYASSLLEKFYPSQGKIRLNSVFRHYLIQTKEIQEKWRDLNKKLLESYKREYYCRTKKELQLTKKLPEELLNILKNEDEKTYLERFYQYHWEQAGY